MRHLWLAASLSLVACAAPAQPDAPFAPGLARYEHVFHGSPANGSLPDIGKADATYPAKSTELLATQSPVKNQDQRGVCTIFTTTALMEHLYIKAGMANPSFSEQYLQWSVKTELGVFPNGEGSNVSDNVEAIHEFGIVDEASDPYNPIPWGVADDPACKVDGTEGQVLPTKCWTQGDPSAAARAAKKFTLPAGKFINTTDIKAHITAEHTAVGLGIDFFYQAWNHGASTLPINRADLRAGVVRYPNPTDVTESHKERAGHGILIVGWDDDQQFQAIDAAGKPVVDASGKPVMQKGFYIFKNSWGTDIFGVDHPSGAGYGWISEQYVTEYATAYVTSVPALDSQPQPPAPPPPPSACQYNCADYGYTAGVCSQGWTCDAQGACLTQGGC
jgi:C1A family cysteine protease